MDIPFKPFPLFKLPKLILMKIFALNTPFELIKITTLSEKSKATVKHLIKKNIVGIKIWIMMEELRLVISPAGEVEYCPLTDDTSLPLGETSQQFESMIGWILYIQDIFQVQECHIALIFCKEEIVSAILQALREIGIQTIVEFLPTHTCSETYTAIMHECSDAAKFTVQAMIRDNNYVFDGFDDYVVKDLSIYYSRWVTFDNLCSLRNCIRVRLFLSFFLPTQLNTFLKLWMEDSKINYLEMPFANEIDQHEPGGIFNGILTYSDGDVVDGKELHVPDPVVVIRRQTDGVLAKITANNQSFVLETETSATCAPFYNVI